MIRKGWSIALALVLILLALVLTLPATGAPIARTTNLVSEPTGVVDPSSGDAGFAGASADGSRVFFVTSQKLTADDGDTNRLDVYERAGGVTTLLSKPTGVVDPATDGADFAGASADGSRVFFSSSEKLTTDDNDGGQVDIYERGGGVTTLLSGPSGVADPGTSDALFREASADGSRVFFTTRQKLTADDGDTNRFDIYERAGGVTRLVSGPSGVADPDSADVFPFSRRGASADGSRVFFMTTEKLTADDGDTNRRDLYKREGGVTTLLSGPSGVADPDSADVLFGGASADGSRVFFTTSQKLTADDGDSNRVDLYERAGGVTTLVSGPSGVADPDSADVLLGGVPLGGFFPHASPVSADGSRVFFITTQKLTADDGDTNRLDVYERAGGVTTLVSRPSGVADPDSDGADFATVSADGSRVFFETNQALASTDGDSGRADVYERAGGVTRLVSGPSGVADPDSAGVFFGDASSDGSRVFFVTTQKLTADDGDTDRNDAYERAGGVTTLLSGPTGVSDPDSDGVGFYRATADGSRAFFETKQKLVPGDADSNLKDVYIAGPITEPPPTSPTRDPTVAPSAGGTRPTAAQIRRALGLDLRAVARSLRKAGIRKLLRRRAVNVKGVDALARGSVRITAEALVRRKGGPVKRVRMLEGKRRFSKAGKGSLNLKLTPRGTALLKQFRRFHMTLSSTFTDVNGSRTRATPRRVTIRR